MQSLPHSASICKGKHQVMCGAHCGVRSGLEEAELERPPSPPLLASLQLGMRPWQEPEPPPKSTDAWHFLPASQFPHSMVSPHPTVAADPWV